MNDLNGVELVLDDPSDGSWSLLARRAIAHLEVGNLDRGRQEAQAWLDAWKTHRVFHLAHTAKYVYIALIKSYLEEGDAEGPNGGHVPGSPTTSPGTSSRCSRPPASGGAAG